MRSANRCCRSGVHGVRTTCSIVYCCTLCRRWNTERLGLSARLRPPPGEAARGRQHALLAPRAPLAPLSSLLGLKGAVGRRQPALPAPPSSRLALKGQRPPRLKGAGGGRQPALLAPPAGAEVSPTGFRHRSETATHPPSSFDIVPDPTLAITVSVVKFEPRWRLIYVGGDDDTDAGARTRDHAHADAVDDAGADARQRRSVKCMQLPGREQSASKMIVQFIARHEAKVEE